jgi:hypothetical protein
LHLRCCWIVVFAAGSLGAQAPSRGPWPEARIDVTLGTATTTHLGLGAHFATGTYARMAVLAGAGVTAHDGKSERSARLEVQGRFHVDPYRQSAVGVYGIGGVLASYDPSADWQGRIVAGGGVELPGGRFAIEAVFSGGLRLSFVTRASRRDRR